MKRYILILSALFAATLSAVAQRPLYIVNGVETEEIESIPPDDIENIESLPADEETIARYGEKAANGVILISLRYDKPAIFEAGTTSTSTSPGRSNGTTTNRQPASYCATP